MLAISHQPTVYIANSQPCYYVQAQTSVPASQWTGGQVVHSGSGYVYSSYPSSSSYPVAYQASTQQLQVARPAVYAVPGHQQIKSASAPMAYAQPQLVQRSLPGGPAFHPPNAVPVVDANDFTPASPVLSEITTSSDDSTGSSSSSASRYNLPPSAINHYTAPQRERRRSFHQNARHPDPYAVHSAGQSSLSLPPMPVGQSVYAQQAQQFSHPSLPTATRQPVFVRNTGRSDHPVTFQAGQSQVYSSFELYKPSAVQQAPSRPALVRRASTTAMAGPVLTSSSYGQGIGLGGAASGLGMTYSGGDRGTKWWKLGR